MIDRIVARQHALLALYSSVSASSDDPRVSPSGEALMQVVLAHGLAHGAPPRRPLARTASVSPHPSSDMQARAAIDAMRSSPRLKVALRAHLDARERDGFATLWLRGQIGQQPDTEAGGITAAKVRARLEEFAALGSSGLLLDIDSQGGLVHEGTEIIDAINAWRTRHGPVVAYVRNAFSMATLVATAADYVVTDLWSTWMLHWTSGGNEKERADANAYVFAHLHERSLFPQPHLQQALDIESWYPASEAEGRGLADEVGDVDRARAVTASCYSRAANRWSAVNLPRTWRRKVLTNGRAWAYGEEAR